MDAINPYWWCREKSGSEAFLFAVAVEEVDEDDDDYLNGSDGEEAGFLAVSEELGAEDGHHRDEIDCEQGWQPDRFADSLHCVMDSFASSLGVGAMGSGGRVRYFDSRGLKCPCDR